MKTVTEHITGLFPDQIVESRALYGSNILTPPVKESLWRQFLKKFADPLIIILMVAGILSIGISFYEYFGLGHSWQVFFEPAGIFVAIMLATTLAFVFELKAEREFTILNQVNDDEPVQVIRSGSCLTVPRRDIVVGDIVVLGTGDEVPADGILLQSTALSVDESSLTGEPLCSKTTDPAHFDPEATYPSNHVLRGTKVMEGHAMMRVTAVGDRTEMGHVYQAARIDDSVKTPLNQQLEKLSRLISSASYCIAGAVIVGRIVHYFDWAPAAWLLIIPTAVFFWLVIRKFRLLSSRICAMLIIAFFFIFIGAVLGLHHALTPSVPLSELLSYTLATVMIAVTLIVVAVPEGLPMAVTLSLAYSMRRMFKTNNLVRKMHACETMGAATVICTDKTGTLTQNRMQVQHAEFFVPAAITAEAIACNSTAAIGADGQPVGNPTEGALLLWLTGEGISYVDIRSGSPVMAEMPFTTERKYMAAIVRSAEVGADVLYVKGAPEVVMDMCSRFAPGADRRAIVESLKLYQSNAMRTLAFAYMVLPSEVHPDEVIPGGRLEASALEFIGYAAIADPVRPDVAEAIARCRNAGIDIKIVTGDTAATAAEIGRQISLISPADDLQRCVLTGPEFAAMSDSELRRCIRDIKIIARARPADKKRLVEVLQAIGEVVAVTGDGTNDAPALKAAHVGLSMGDGTSVAKEASDITIIDNSFSSICRAVMWGRSLYRNIQRFLLFQLTVNVSACMLVLFGAFMGAESPLTVTQMLWVNLIMDTFGAVALASLPPSPGVMRERPRDRRASILSRAMRLDIVCVGCVFFLLLVVFLYIFQHAAITSMTDLMHLPRYISPAHELTPYETTLLFSIFVWTHFWYMFNTRGFHTGRSGLDLRHCGEFIFIAAIIVVGQIAFIEVPYLNSFFNVVPMRLDDWVVIVVGSSAVMWLREAYILIKGKSRSHNLEN